LSANNAAIRMSTASTAGLLMASAQAPLGSTLIAVALPSISPAISADLVLITGLLVTGYLVVNVVCLGPAGKISDVVGHSRILWTGIGLYLVGAAFGVMAQGVSFLFLSRCLMAVAGALVVPATPRPVATACGRGATRPYLWTVWRYDGNCCSLRACPGRRDREPFGWRAVFIANVPFLAVSALLLHRYPLPAGSTAAQRPLRKLTRSLDFMGIGLLALSLTLLIVSSKLDGTLCSWPWFWRQPLPESPSSNGRRNPGTGL